MSELRAREVLRAAMNKDRDALQQVNKALDYSYTHSLDRILDAL